MHFLLMAILLIGRSQATEEPTSNPYDGIRGRPGPEQEEGESTEENVTEMIRQIANKKDGSPPTNKAIADARHALLSGGQQTVVIRTSGNEERARAAALDVIFRENLEDSRPTSFDQ